MTQPRLHMETWDAGNESWNLSAKCLNLVPSQEHIGMLSFIRVESLLIGIFYLLLSAFFNENFSNK